VYSLSTLFGWFPQLRALFAAKSDREFDAFLDVHFEQCVQRMEAEAHHLASDSEEKLSAFLAAALSIPGLAVVREGYSNGRVDLTIRTESLMSTQQRLAEAKIYGGHAYHAQAITQLLARYSTGRQPTGYVIEYVKKPEIEKIVARLRKQSDTEFPEIQQGLTADHLMRWAYTSNHTHSSGRVVKVVHINVNLHR
jgi:hypothetical protein